MILKAGTKITLATAMGLFAAACARTTEREALLPVANPVPKQMNEPCDPRTKLSFNPWPVISWRLCGGIK